MFFLFVPVETVSSEKALKVVYSLDIPQSNQTQPFIYEDNLVFTNDRNGNLDIFSYDLANHNLTQITSDPYDQQNPHLQGSKLVFEDDRNGNWGIYYHNLFQGFEEQITTDPENQKNPFIFRNYNWITWVENDHGNSEIYYLNLNEDMAEKPGSDNLFIIMGLLLMILAFVIIINIIKVSKKEDLPKISDIKDIKHKKELIKLCKKYKLDTARSKKQLKRRLIEHLEVIHKGNINKSNMI